MAIETEKKYSVTAAERDQILEKLRLVNAQFEGEDFETNLLFAGGDLSAKASILRLRTTADKAVLTYKESLPGESGVKQRIEHETALTDGAAMFEILTSLGFVPSMVYEKRRQTWVFEAVEIVVDELPFGFYLEIEGAETDILNVEQKLELTELTIEHNSYPALTARHGKRNSNLIEARF